MVKYKTIILFVTVWLYIDCYAQQYAPIPDSHKHTVYIDNIVVGNECGIDIERIPCVLLENYYSKYIDFSTNDSLPKTIKSKIVKKIYIEKDTILHKNSLHIRTKKAKDGFLYVNQRIMDKVASLGCDLDNIKVSYVYNNREVTTKEDVMRIIKLRKKRIQISEIVTDEQSGIITVYIFDK